MYPVRIQRGLRDDRGGADLATSSDQSHRFNFSNLREQETTKWSYLCRRVSPALWEHCAPLVGSVHCVVLRQPLLRLFHWALICCASKIGESLCLWTLSIALSVKEVPRVYMVKPSGCCCVPLVVECVCYIGTLFLHHGFPRFVHHSIYWCRCPSTWWLFNQWMPPLSNDHRSLHHTARRKVSLVPFGRCPGRRESINQRRTR